MVVVGLGLGFTSWQHRRSYQHGNFIVLPHWDTCDSVAPWPNIPLSHITLITSPCPIILMPDARLGGNKYKFDKLLDSALISTPRPSTRKARALLIRPPYVVIYM